uniref:glutathione gamma-glutamylcysteinyltransferase n=1 Tax=Plectus sambesii TaxID=2011161 RepID=A0A914WDW1_9BILA
MSATAKQFYRRQLPSTCVDFSSELGKALFTSSLLKGHANIYFKLAAQFRTQDEPLFCGLSTLVMVLNALEVDPGRVWKGSWRWYHESMLDCCAPLETVMKTGINLRQFACLAVCNRLSVRTEQIDPDSNMDAALIKFRQDLIASVVSEDTVLVTSFNRGVLGQTGGGHFSPIAAYDEGSDRALIMDVARFKYPPHWVELKLLHQAMQSVDKSTSAPRGYFVMSLRKDTRPLILFRLHRNFAVDSKQLNSQLTEWRAYLQATPADQSDDLISTTLTKFRELFEEYSLCCKIINGDKCTPCSGMEAMLDEQLSECCKLICKQVKAGGVYERMAALGLAKQHAALTALLLAWPLDIEPPTGRVEALSNIIAQDVQRFDAYAKNEIDLLRIQIRTRILGVEQQPALHDFPALAPLSSQHLQLPLQQLQHLQPLQHLQQQQHLQHLHEPQHDFLSPPQQVHGLHLQFVHAQ